MDQYGADLNSHPINDLLCEPITRRIVTPGRGGREGGRERGRNGEGESEGQRERERERIADIR